MLLLSPLAIAAAGVFLAVIQLVRCIRSPLWSVPGPFLANFTSLLLKWKELGANRTAYIHSLHLKYGPVVRIAPNEVSFTSWPALKEIYCSGGSGYDKTEFYKLFRPFDRKTMFSTLNKADHAKRKRIIADRYANTNIMRSASLHGIQERSRQFVQRCISAQNMTADIFMGLHSYACDCVTHHLFHPNGSECLQNKEDEEMMHQVAADDSLQNRIIFYYNPTLHRLFERILCLFAKPRETPLANNFVLEMSKRTDAASFTLMSRLDEKKGELAPIDIAAECIDHMAAGIDTTGDALCFLMWELSQPRSLHFQQRLAKEMVNHPNVAIDQLPFLDAVVCEGLRCFPAIPMSLPRYVPNGGRSIDGLWVPERTIVSCQAYSVHRVNDDVFPDPEAFNPDRWLDDTGDTDRRRLLFAFANGGRGCVGKHLALAEMKTLLRDVYSQFSTTPDASMTPDSMEMSDQLISSQPRGRKCLLKFHPLGSSKVTE